MDNVEIEAERVKFEAWILRTTPYRGIERSKSHPDEYHHSLTQSEWWGWLACAESKQAEIETLERTLKIATIKGNNSLANNLCSDHRDKQTGKPCLACTIETLERELAEAKAEIEAAKAEAECYRQNLNDAQGDNDCNANRVVELERELAEARKDAERYQWLRSYNTAKHPTVTDAFFLGDVQLDAAIDDAMAKEPK